MPEVVEQRFFSKFDAEGGNNKFWNVKLFDDGSVESHWGPQGLSGTVTLYPAGHVKSGKSGFDKLIKGKLAPRKGYTENKVVEAVTSSSASSVRSSSKAELAQKAVDDIAKGQPDLQKLIRYFADVNAHNLYHASGGKISYNTTTGLFSTTQGVVTLDQIQEARDFLDAIAVFSNKKVFDGDKFFSSVNPYLSIIPQQGLVRKIEFESMFGTRGLQKQTDILDALEASYVTALAQPKAKTKKSKVDTPMFRVTLNRVDDKKEFDKIRSLYQKTKGGHRDVSHYKVYTVYKLEIEAMADAFESKGRKIGNIMRLWHGTKASNVLSILKSGFFLPRTGGSIHITGSLFGSGIYASDNSTKAIRYATGAWGGGGVDRKFMFLADFAMGKSHTPKKQHNYGYYDYKMPNGYDSCFAKADISGVINNEMIVYNLYQINPVYLIEFTSGGKS